MGKRGPKPTPTPILALHGSRLVEKRNDADAVEGSPVKPDWLEGEASEEWDRQVSDLEARGLLFQTDRAALAMYCQSWGEFVESVQYIQHNGDTIVTDKGNVIQHPKVGIKNQAWDRCNKMGQQFGFSLSSRVGIGNAQKKPVAGPSAMARKRSS